VLAPLLELHCAAGILRAVASRDTSGRLGVLAEALPNTSPDDEFDVLVRQGVMTESAAARARRRVEYDIPGR